MNFTGCPDKFERIISAKTLLTLTQMNRDGTKRKESIGPQISTCRKQAKTTQLQTHATYHEKRQDESESGTKISEGAESHGDLFSDLEINQGTSSLSLAAPQNCYGLRIP